MKKTLDIIAIGAANIDIVARIEKFPGPDDQVFISSLNYRHGGSAANTAVACAKLGLKTGFLGKMAGDAMGKELNDSFREASVDTSAIIEVSDVPSGQVFIALDGKGDRRMFTFPGAPQMLKPGEILERMPYISSSYVVHMSSLSTPKPHFEVSRHARNEDYILSLNPGGMISALGHGEMKPIFDELDILFASRNEINRMFGKGSVEENAGACFENSSVELLVVTRGEKGSQFFLHDYTSEIAPAIKVPVVDTTGAGDAFCGAFLSKFIPPFKKWMNGIPDKISKIKQAFHAYMLEMKDDPRHLVACLKAGNDVASRVIEHEGAREGLPGMNEIDGS